MMDEYYKCHFCKYYDLYEGCEWGCDNFKDYEPDKNRIIEFSKEKGISIRDIISLINMN